MHIVPTVATASRAASRIDHLYQRFAKGARNE